MPMLVNPSEHVHSLGGGGNETFGKTMHMLTGLPKYPLQHAECPMSVHSIQIAETLGNEVKIATKSMGVSDSGRDATDRAVIALIARVQDPGGQLPRIPLLQAQLPIVVVG